jgi:hypothetical protein
MSRLPPGGGGKLFTAALLAIAGPGLAIYAFATAGDAVSDNAAMWTRIAGAVLGAFFLFIAYVLYRKVVPPKARHLKVTLSAIEARRGDTVDARLEVTRAGSEEIELGLVCTEYYDVEKTSYSSNSGSTRYRDTEDAVAHEEWRPASPRRSSRRSRARRRRRSASPRTPTPRLSAGWRPTASPPASPDGPRRVRAWAQTLCPPGAWRNAPGQYWRVSPTRRLLRRRPRRRLAPAATRRSPARPAGPRRSPRR